MTLTRLIVLSLFYGSNARKLAPPQFRVPECEQLDYVNPLIGNGGDTPNGSGGMIPSTAPPFAMTRWVAQTHENYVSVTPYNYTAHTIHGFQATHQPAIWMGESANVAIIPGASTSPLVSSSPPKTKFRERGLRFVQPREENEIITPSYYSVQLELTEKGDHVRVEQSATSRVGHLRFTFSPSISSPYILIEASRPSVITSTPSNITYPTGTISSFNAPAKEICGTNTEIQDLIIAPISIKENASQFKGYFCVRFDRDWDVGRWGLVKNGTVYERPPIEEGEDEDERGSPLLSAYVYFPPGTVEINFRVGVSFISIDQARMNLDDEVPDGTSLEETARRTRESWVEKMGRVRVEGGSEEDKIVFYTAVYHTFHYPYEQHESGHYYSAYDNTIHKGESYSGYSVWDIFRAEWAWLILMAPERVPSMITSMLQDYQQGGWLPMWKNIFETNIMIGTHADSLIAEAVVKNVTGFDIDLAWEAVLKDATVAPEGDDSVVYDDREENVDYEVRAGLDSIYSQKGWVADDIHSESASRTLDYAYDDHALYTLGLHLHKPPSLLSPFLNRSLHSPFTLYNPSTGFIEARTKNGSWAGPDRGWTEGDKWAYTFDFVHHLSGLVERRRKQGGKLGVVKFLDDHFDGGYNDHTNEPSHHIPYLYAMLGAAGKTQERVRQIARENYNETVRGLSGNEDCGQMSAWYIFSALGWYPVNPVSGEYIIGSPFFDKITIQLPSPSSPSTNKKPLIINAPGAAGSSKPYVHGVSVNGVDLDKPMIRHEDFANGGVEVVFRMSDEVGILWGNELLFQDEDEDEDEDLDRSEL